MTTYRNRLQTTVSAVASSGLGAFTISAASSGYISFVSGDNTLSFDISVVEGTAWETRTGCVYTHSGTSLARGTLESSSTGSAIAFTAAAIVTATPTAAKLAALELQLVRGFTFIRSPSTGTQTLTSGFNKIASILTEAVENPYTWWDTTNKKFTPQRAGLYQIVAGAQLDVVASRVGQAAIYLNGFADSYGAVFVQGTAMLPIISTIVKFNGSTDYAEFYVYIDGTADTTVGVGRVLFKAIYLGP